MASQLESAARPRAANGRQAAVPSASRRVIGRIDRILFNTK
jgi:hypothetical protein